jgi:23S rRNA pseudouridine1911/1915/1917 synthase
VGDPVYGRGKAAPPSLRRQFLHAQRLAFRHPRTGERLELEAPLADDLRETLEALDTLSP